MKENEDIRWRGIAFTGSPRFQVRHRGDEALFVAESSARVMIGDLPQAIVNDLKMGATIDDLAEKYATKYSPAEIRGALWALSEIGYLRPLRTSSSNTQAWWDEISDEKRESSVTIQNLSGVAASQKVLHSAPLPRTFHPAKR